LPWQPTHTTQMQQYLCDPWSLPFHELKNDPASCSRRSEEDSSYLRL
jgi:hypothetical protein